MSPPLKRRYGGPRRRGGSVSYTYKSMRVFPGLLPQLEAMAGREFVSFNSLCNALLDLACTLDETPEGRDLIHQTCTTWRVRWEHKRTAERRARAEADG